MAKNPFLDANANPGHGEIHLCLLPPNTPSFKSLSFTYPLKLVSSSAHWLPPSQEEPSASNVPLQPASVPLVFLLSYGGGLLPPDKIFVKITLEPQTRLTLTTQGSTKIFPSPLRDPVSSPSSEPLPPHVATQDLDVKLLPGAALLLCPDPSQPFRNSNYSQTQIVEVSEDSSLGLLDWVTSGRPARGEVWDAGSWKGKNELWQAPSVDANGHSTRRRLVLRDNVLLTGGPSGVGQYSLKAEGMGVIGTFILHGPLFDAMGDFFVEEFTSMPRIGGRDWGDKEDLDSKQEEHRAWRSRRLDKEKKDGVVWSAARVRGLVLVKFGAREVEGAREWLGAMCQREGTIAEAFGPGGLMALR